MYYFVEYDSDTIVHLEINGRTKEEVVEKVKEFHAKNNWYKNAVYSVQRNEVYVCSDKNTDILIKVGYIANDNK